MLQVPTLVRNQHDPRALANRATLPNRLLRNPNPGLSGQTGHLVFRTPRVLPSPRPVLGSMEKSVWTEVFPGVKATGFGCRYWGFGFRVSLGALSGGVYPRRASAVGWHGPACPPVRRGNSVSSASDSRIFSCDKHQSWGRGTTMTCGPNGCRQQEASVENLRKKPKFLTSTARLGRPVGDCPYCCLSSQSVSVPFEEGMPVWRGSGEVAWRRARAVALKMASLMWWLLEPWCSSTCRFIRALPAQPRQNSETS